MAKPDPVVSKIRKALESYSAVEIPGGPVETSLRALDTLWLLSFFCNPAIRAGMQITPKGQKKPKALYALPGNGRPEFLLNEFTLAAKDAAEGDVLEVLCASEADVYQTKDDLDDYGTGRSKAEIAAIKTSLRDAAKQRYVGTVGTNQRWQITHAWPALDAASLNNALEVLAKIKTDRMDWARGPEEMQALLDLAKLSNQFPLRNPVQLRENTIEINKRDIIVKGHRRPFLAMLLCRHRFPSGPWNFKTNQLEDAFWVHVEDENERRIRERMRQMSLAGSQTPSNK
ncbi:MAG TPA: hypothetical protein VKH63_06730 [Candidatus Acidoferrum sp.]|nr:hypothetical protein [Candidatus Acidoferrum sp.]